LSRLGFVDVRAPIGQLGGVSYTAATRAIAGAFGAFDPDTGAIVDELFAAGCIDAEPRPGKQAGAFCRALGPNRLPCIMLSYFDRVDSVIALAHEIGHAVHFVHSGRTQTPLSFDAPGVLNEVPAQFAELLAYDWLIEHAADADSRQLLAAKRLDSNIEATFLTVFVTRFEERIHAARQAGEILTSDRIGELWTDCAAAFYGPDFELPTSWGLHWVLVPHLMHAPFSSYTYTMSRLGALDLHRRYRDDRQDFTRRFIEFLGRGGSASPVAQLADLGLDITGGGAWASGINELDRTLRHITRC